MNDSIGYIILFFGFCVVPALSIALIAFLLIRRTTKSANAKTGITSARAKAGTPSPPRAGLSPAPAAKTSVLARATPAPPDGGWTPLYLTFSDKPRVILENMDGLLAQADKVNATKTRWSKGPRLLFWSGLGLMLVEGLIFLLGYTPSCAFVTGGIVLWVIAIVFSVSLKRAQVKAFPPTFNEFEQIVHTLRDDLRPGTGFLGNLDLTGARQSSKVARSANDAKGRTTQYFRDQWLNFKAKLHDGNVLRVSGIQRLKERNGYWGRGKISGKSKWKPAKFKGAYQELKVRIAVNPEVYKIVRNSEIKVDSQVGDYTINAVDTEGGIITVLASSPRETVSAESVLGVLKSVYGLLQVKKA
jgi:hypothetical protein